MHNSQHSSESEQQELERVENLRQVNIQLAQAQQIAHIGSWQWDVAENKINWSDELYRINGLSKNAFTPEYESYLNCSHPDDRELVNQTMQKAYVNHQPFSFLHRIIRPDGEERFIHSRGEVFTDDKKATIKMTGTAQDVTEEKQAALHLVQLNKQLLERNNELLRSNTELASFSYVASHDLQEPLRKIKAFLSRILDKEEQIFSSTTKDYFNRITTAASRMQNLIEALLSYSRTNTSEIDFKPTDLNILIEEVLLNLQDTIEEKRAIITLAPLPVLNIIPLQFHQLLTNIISNAIKYSRLDMQLQINITAVIIAAKEIKTEPALANEKYWKISIADNGIGFEQQYEHKIFELFQRLHGKSEYTGTGIGLAICKKIMQNHSGFINATGQPGIGATFNIYLPLIAL
ncbi:MAG: ATP-binding protein [Bacteroidia bacterium]